MTGMPARFVAFVASAVLVCSLWEGPARGEPSGS
jgi:hypothetical protein